MLIIPVERQLDWRKPPLMTLAIILINVLVFFLYQSQDSDLLESAVEEYLAADLPELEAPVYLDYLERGIRLKKDDRMELATAVADAIEKKEAEWLAYVILLDSGFYVMLVEEGTLFWQNDTYAEWKQVRSTIVENYIDNISARRLGLIPAEIQLSDLIGYQFLHGGIGHLLGNMVFLFLLGFTVERALGKSKYLIAYLLCGVLSGLFFAAFDSESLVPLVGASGSISGLMGMYVAIFGLQKIRFFYFLGVYFNYFTAPALAILPVWVGKEIYDYWLGEASRIAYMAHAGGLIAGAGMVWLLGKSWLQINEEFYEPDETEQDEAFRKHYSKALSLVSQMEFKKAKVKFAALYKEYPDNIGMLEHLYHLEKLDHTDECYHQHTKQLIDAALKKNVFSLMLETYKDYLKRVDSESCLDVVYHNKVLYACLRNDSIKDAERAFDNLKKHPDISPDVLREACQVLIQEFKKRQQTMKINQYQTVMAQL
ncbi:rhomboid family intramembrane serine protease [Alkalimarinus sediminis]|uniref:Rhomboid family intramembrane serine protease n=1 Tax=Alkalimarinus sediminis TaxID=1632866 RepID=A0A9E8KJ22_9ALTE|nr:rhomboid family intramembrane serine protease [Alkalimarinus sediminis]UZW74541.1 rhomboid family intramembrane serine protease [Alkalimarinus sediminis]